MSSFAPVRRVSVSAAVFDQLASQIVDGRLGVGTSLPAERSLTDQFGVNRQALREALQRLDQMGLVEIRHGDATRVCDYRRSAGLDLLPRLLTSADGTISVTVVRSVMEMRSAIGADAAALCAARLDQGGISALSGLVDSLTLASAGDVARPALLGDIDTRYWDAIVDGSDNICYRLSLNALRRVYQPVESLVDQILVDERADVAGHRAVVAAIAAGDARRARSAAIRLLARGSDALLSHLEAV
jgi:DNA-binding FadR family transcriptional regulator